MGAQKEAAPTASPDADRLERLLADRYSCRRFLGDPVPQPTIRRILDIARRTPSSNNAQPWQVVITNGAGTERFRRGFHEAASNDPPASDFPLPDYQGAHRDRRRECGLRLYESVGIDREDKAAAQRQMLENFNLYGAPHAMIVHMDPGMGASGILDCGAFAHTFVLAARALGVDSIAQNAFWIPAPFIRRHFGLPEHHLIVTGVSFGYADREHPINGFRTTRAAIDELVRWIDD